MGRGNKRGDISKAEEEEIIMDVIEGVIKVDITIIIMEMIIIIMVILIKMIEIIINKIIIVEVGKR